MSGVAASAPRIAVRGRFWRMLAPRWSHAPQSGEGAARAGGRWNGAGQGALYLSADHGTAIAEYQQDLPRPGTLTAYDVATTAIFDLMDPATLRLLDLDSAILRLPWKRVRDVDGARPATWDLAAAASAAGVQGVRVPSVQAAGVNLVLWAWNRPGGASVAAIDPLGDLPADAAS